MTTPKLRKGAAVLLSAGALLASFVGSADAGTRTYTDPSGDTRSLDLTTVSIRYGARLFIKADHNGWPTYRNTGYNLTYFIDTKFRNAGPEFYALIIPNSDGLLLYKTDNWGKGTSVVNCPRLRAFADMFNGEEPVWVSIPGRCIGAPARVRVAVRSQAERPFVTYADWVAGKRQFIRGWVQRY